MLGVRKFIYTIFLSIQRRWSITDANMVYQHDYIYILIWNGWKKNQKFTIYKYIYYINIYKYIYIYIYYKPKTRVISRSNVGVILNKKTHFSFSLIFRLFSITFYSVINRYFLFEQHVIPLFAIAFIAFCNYVVDFV